MREAAKLRARLAIGDRKEVGAATSVAVDVVEEPRLLPMLLECLDDADPAVVAHAAHAAMQVAPHVDALRRPLEDEASRRLCHGPGTVYGCF